MAYSKLGRNSAARKALFRDLVTDLIINERIETTESKAKEVRSIAEKMITLASAVQLLGFRPGGSFPGQPGEAVDDDAVDRADRPG